MSSGGGILPLDATEPRMAGTESTVPSVGHWEQW